MRTAFKRVLERALVRSGAVRVRRALRRAGPVVLAYHNVAGAPGEGEPPGEAALHIDPDRFREHMEAIRERFEVVSLQSLLRSGEDDRRPRGAPQVAITFDDGYAGALRTGVEILTALGLPSTIFVVPGLLGSDAFWWDALSDPATGEMAASVRDQALWQCGGAPDRVREWARNRGIAWQPPAWDRRPGGRDELRSAAENPLVTFGSHTWDHPNLAALDPDAVAHQMARCKRWLDREMEDTAMPWITYPYGLETVEVRAAAQASGFDAGFRVAGGAFPRRGVDRFGLPRLNVPAGLSTEGLVLRVEGIL